MVAKEKGGIKWEKWKPIISLVVLLSYAFFTSLIFWEIRKTNKLTEIEQEITNRPYVIIEDVKTDIFKGKTADETWKMNALLSNSGTFPATNLQIHASVDQFENRILTEKPKDLKLYSIGTVYGKVAKTLRITKKEILNILDEHQVCYLHIYIWYSDINDKSYSTKSSYELYYVSGDYLIWDNFNSEIK